MKKNSMTNRLMRIALCLAVAALSGSVVQAQSTNIGFETPTYTSGPLNGQGSWTVTSDSNVVQTASELTNVLTGLGLTPGVTVHSGDQALLIGDAGQGSSHSISDMADDFSTAKIVEVDAWIRPLTYRNTLGTNNNLGNLFMTVEDPAGINGRTAAFRFGYEDAAEIPHIDYATDDPGIWHNTGIPWTSNTWYHFKLDISYVTKTYDFYVDDTLVASNITFYAGNNSSSMQYIRLFHGGDNPGAIVDDISITNATPADTPLVGNVSSTPYSWAFDIADAPNGNTPDTNTITVMVDGASVTPTIVQSGNIGTGDGSGVTTVSYDSPTPILATGSSHTNAIHFEGTGFSAQDVMRSYTIAPVVGTLDRVHHYKATFGGVAAYSGISSGVSSNNGDLAVDFGNADPAVQQADLVDSRLTSTDPGLLAALHNAFDNDTLSASFWVKRHEGISPLKATVLWISASSASGSRGWNIHCPYYDIVYFDTGDTGSGRVSDSAYNVSTYTGNVDWWYTWRHVVAIKNGGEKQIWVDGELVVNQPSGAPSMAGFSDVTKLIIGNEPGNGPTRGWMDDVALYSSALSSSDVAALYSGTSPDAISGASTNLIAWWDLNDGPVIDISTDGSSAILNYNQVLQSSTNVSGPFTDVSGATSPYTNTAPDSQMFFRTRKY